MSSNENMYKHFKPSQGSFILQKKRQSKKEKSFHFHKNENAEY